MSSCPPLAGAEPCVNDFIDEVDDQCLEGVLESLTLDIPRLTFITDLLAAVQTRLTALNLNLTSLLSSQLKLADARSCLDAFTGLPTCITLLAVSAAVDATKARIDVGITSLQALITSTTASTVILQNEINVLTQRISDTASLKDHLESCLP